MRPSIYPVLTIVYNANELDFVEYMLFAFRNPYNHV